MHTITLPLSVTNDQQIQANIAFDIYPPHCEQHNRHVWLFCIPGGSYRGFAYYDRRIPDLSYSMVWYMQQHGIGVIVLDNLGTGESTFSSPISGTLLTADVCASVYAQMAEALKTRLLQGTLLDEHEAIDSALLTFIGVGHSMGGYLLTWLQAMYTSFDAVIFLGWSLDALQAVQKQTETPDFPYEVSSDGYVLPAALRRTLGPLFFSERVPPTLIERDNAEATRTPLALFANEHSMYDTKRQAAQIACPLLFSFGGIDLTARPRDELAHYQSATDMQLLIQPQAHHCANFEPSRTQLWEKIASWCRLSFA